MNFLPNEDFSYSLRHSPVPDLSNAGSIIFLIHNNWVVNVTFYDSASILTIRKAPRAECAKKDVFLICLRSPNKTLLIDYDANEEILNLPIFGHKQGLCDPFRDLNIVWGLQDCHRSIRREILPHNGGLTFLLAKI